MLLFFLFFFKVYCAALLGIPHNYPLFTSQYALYLIYFLCATFLLIPCLYFIIPTRSLPTPISQCPTPYPPCFLLQSVGSFPILPYASYPVLIFCPYYFAPPHAPPSHPATLFHASLINFLFYVVLHSHHITPPSSPSSPFSVAPHPMFFLVCFR